MTTHNDPTTVTPTTDPAHAADQTAPQTAPQAAPQAVRWVYWIAYSFRDGGGATETSFSAPITHGESLIHLAEQLARTVGSSPVVITGFTLLRVEDSNSEVIS